MSALKKLETEVEKTDAEKAKMSALEQLETEIEKARRIRGKFFVEEYDEDTHKKFGGSKFTTAEAIGLFENLLKSVETSMNNPDEIKIRLTQEEIESVAKTINILSTAFSSKNYQIFVETLNHNIKDFSLLITLSMEMDKARIQHLNDIKKLGVAFDDQAQKLGDRDTKLTWLIFGVVSSLCAVGAGMFFLEVSFEWHIILFRLALISVFLGLSAFGFSHYSKNKSLEYDYAFKAALASSYPGISSQFDDESRKEYAGKFMLEILRDPQRKRHDLAHPPSVIKFASKIMGQHK